MKGWLFQGLLLFIVTCSADAGGTDVKDGRPWAFVESVGGIAIGSASRGAEGGVFLGITCDVSGLRTVTRKPTSLNSALVVTKINKKIEGRTVLVSINTGLPSGTYTSTCPGVDLGDLPVGDYQVFYSGSNREGHLLGKVTVPPK